ncbi:apoptosis inhibitor [Brazilian porcupinepox virus 1]|nr:apoptosis inhibitor [Brazilian porcupinepox virus 1]
MEYKNINNVIEAYIQDRGGLHVENVENFEKNFEKLKAFDYDAIKKFGECDYEFIKNMKLSLDDGPRLDKLDENMLSNINYKEAIGLCAILSEKVTHPNINTRWSDVFDSLFYLLKDEDFDELDDLFNKNIN